MESRCKQRSMETQWPRTRQAALNYREPQWAPARATLLGDWMCSQTCWGYWVEGLVWRMAQDHKNQLSWAAPHHTITRQQSIFCSKKRDLPWSNFILSQALHKQSSPSFPPSPKESHHHPHFCILSSYQGFHISWRVFLLGKVWNTAINYSDQQHSPQHPVPSQ